MWKPAPKPKAREASGLDEHVTRMEFSNKTGPQGVTDKSNAGNIGLSPVTPTSAAVDVDSSSVTFASTTGNTVYVAEPGRLRATMMAPRRELKCLSP